MGRRTGVSALQERAGRPAGEERPLRQQARQCDDESLASGRIQVERRLICLSILSRLSGRNDALISRPRQDKSTHPDSTADEYQERQDQRFVCARADSTIDRLSTLAHV